MHAGSELFVWTGEGCPDEFKTAALHFAGQLHKYEIAPSTPVMIRQGEETEEFWRSLELVSTAAAKGGCTPTPGPAPGATVRDVHAVPAYDKDYDIFGRAVLHSPDGLSSPCDSARSGRKTPRTEVPQAASPNDRLRKHARSEAIERERERSARTSRSSGGSGSFSGSFGIGSESARNRALDYQELAVRRRAPSLPSGRPPLTPRGTASNEVIPSPRAPLASSMLPLLGALPLTLLRLLGPRTMMMMTTTMTKKNMTMTIPATLMTQLGMNQHQGKMRNGQRLLLLRLNCLRCHALT